MEGETISACETPSTARGNLIPEVAPLERRFDAAYRAAGDDGGGREQAFRLLGSPRRAAWALLCAPVEDQRALVLQNQWGYAPAVLAGGFAAVLVLDADPIRCRVSNALFSSTSLDLHYDAEASLTSLSKDGSKFATIVLDGTYVTLLERFGEDLAGMLERLLGDDGDVLVIERSRFGVSYLKDALKSARRWQTLVDGIRSRASTRASRLGALTRDATVSDIAYLYPDPVEPKQIFGNGHRSADDKQGILHRLLVRGGLMPYLHNGFARRLARGAHRPSLFEQIARLLPRALPGSDQAFAGCRVTWTGTVVVEATAPAGEARLAKVMLSDAANERGRRAEHALVLAHDQIADLARVAPQIRQRQTIAGLSVWIEDAVSGISTLEALRAGAQWMPLLHEARGFLDLLHSAGVTDTEFTGEDLDALLDTTLRPLKARFPAEAEPLSRLESKLADALLGSRLPRLWTHGDFGIRNVLVHPDTFRLSGVVDWDSAEPQGLPLVDLLHFALSRRRYLEGLQFGPVVLSAARDEALTAEENRVVGEYLETLGLTARSVPPLLTIYWLRHVAAASRWGLKSRREPWIRDNFTVPLAELEQLL